ncbi:MAG TPA: TonB-dependent receptor plug domain-containing protein, partial [Chitinophagaceae bacterium]|nr:TonB-dependent receptor plug domain-containing protein [Chitinophagaceae bacterium]
MKRTALLFGFSLSNLLVFAQNANKDTIDLTPVEVRATRATNLAPFTKLNIGKEEVQKANLGQDLPFLLNSTPGAVASSDAGTGIGYTGLRIRGTDLTRINVTLNGIPYNDAESGGVFFVDLPDFASSVGSIQIQRGAGTSSNGGGAFGATVNLSTNELNVKPYGDIINGFGSFNTRRHTVKVGTGLLHDHFTVDARLSSIQSNGFIDRSESDLQSYYLSGAWTGKKTTIRFNTFSGKEKTYQAWSGIPEHKLNFNSDSLLNHYYNNIGVYYFNEADSINLFHSDRRKYNVYRYPNQTDNYKQDHYQLFFNHHLPGVNLSTAFYLTKGAGYYEELKYNQKYSSYGLPNLTSGTSIMVATDLVRQLWLKNNLYGGVASLQGKKNKWDYTAGLNWNRFEGQHYGNITWAMQGIQKDYEW